MVTIYIGNARCKMTDLDDDNVIRELESHLSYHVQSFEFMPKHGDWDGRYRLFNRKSGVFPIGLLTMSINILKAHKVPYKLIDNREVPDYGTPLKIKQGGSYEARDYQSKAIDAAIKAGSGILKMSTGSGKSYVISSIVAKMNIKTIIYVVSIDLMYQMYDVFNNVFGISIGMVGDGICNIKDITVMTIWSAASAFNSKISSLDAEIKQDKIKKKDAEKVRKCVESANMFVLDECQYAGSNTFQFLSRESKSAIHRFLFSGTPWREAGDDILLEAVSGPQIVNIGASELIEKGFLVRPYITFKSMPTIRNIGSSYPEVYKNFIINNDYRNFYIADSTKKLVQSGRTVLIIYSKIAHGEILQDFIKEQGVQSIILNGGNNSQQRSDSIQKVKDGECKIILASSIFDQGIDIPILDSLIMAGGGKSTARVLQRIGRVMRPYNGKKNAIILDFFDNSKYLRQHSMVRYKTCMTEKEYVVKKK